MGCSIDVQKSGSLSSVHTDANGTPITTVPLPNQSTPTDPCASQVANDFARETCVLLNQIRAQNNLGPLLFDEQQIQVAQAYAKKMSDENFFSHTAADGKTFNRRLVEGGVRFSYAGENIALGQTTPQQAVDSWMNSSGHRANILNPDFKRQGIGFYNYRWVNVFTN